MTPTQIQLVQQTFRMVVPIADTIADLFYTRLFELDPLLRRMFPTDLREQKIKLIIMLGYAVNGLTRLDQIVPAVRDLGRRHADYGVSVQMYDTVGSALLWTLGQGLGAAFTDPVREAWTAAYLLLASSMQNGAAEDKALRIQAVLREMEFEPVFD